MTATATKDRLEDLDLSTITPDPEQPRKVFADEGIAELACSMAAEGLLQPITVKPAPTHKADAPAYILIAGERRFRAATKLGWNSILSIVKNGIGEWEAAKLQLIENIVRQDLNPVEEARAYKKMLDGGYTLGEVSAAVGLPNTQISWRVTMLGARDDVLALVARGHITPSSGLAMAKISYNGQGRVLRAIGNGRLNTRDIAMMCGQVWAEENQSEMFSETKLTDEQLKAVRTFSEGFAKVGSLLRRIVKMQEDNPQALAEAFMAEGPMMSVKIGEAIKGLNRVRSMIDRERVGSELKEAE